MVADPATTFLADKEIVDELVRILKLPEAQRPSNDAKTFQTTLFLALAPKSLPHDASEEDKKEFQLTQNRIITRLGLKGTWKRMMKSCSQKKLDRESIPDSLERPKLVEPHRRKSPRTTVNTEAMRQSLKSWALSKSDQIKQSCNTKDQVFAREHGTNKFLKDQDGNKIRVQTAMWTGTVASLYKEAKKPVEEGGWDLMLNEIGEPTMGESTFGKMMPKEFRKLTQNHAQDCVCVNCQDAKFCMMDLMAYNRKRVQKLQQCISSLEQEIANVNVSSNRISAVAKVEHLQ